MLKLIQNCLEKFYVRGQYGYLWPGGKIKKEPYYWDYKFEAIREMEKFERISNGT